MLGQWNRSIEVDNDETSQPPINKRQRRYKDSIIEFLTANSSQAANRTVKLNNTTVPARNLQDSIPQLFRQYNGTHENTQGLYFYCVCVYFRLHLLFLVSESTFRRVLKDEKRFVQSQKASDLCETCETGKLAKERLPLLQQSLSGCPPERQESLKEEIRKLQETVAKFDKHYATKTEQRNAFKLQRSTLTNNHGVVVLDFKENIVIGGGPREVNSTFYSKSPRTLLGFVFYTMDNGKVRKRHINILSDVLSHDAGFVVYAFKQVLKLDFVQSLSSLSVWSDCGPHFRCKEFCHFLFKEVRNLCVNLNHLEWNLFAERHGKSCCDSHFSILSRWKREIETHTSINDTRTLIDEWTKKAAGTSIDMQFIEISKQEFSRENIHTST